MTRYRITVGMLMTGVLLVAVAFALLRPDASPTTWAFVPPVLAIVAAQVTLSLGIPRRMVLLFVAVGILLLPFLGAMLVSKMLWGYFLARPAPDRRIVNARSVDSAKFFMPQDNGAGGWVFVPRNSWSMARARTYWVEHAYYTLEDRVLIALRKRGRLPDNVQRTDDGLIARLYGLLERTGKLDGGWPGYPEAKQLRGVVLEATGADGTPLLFVAVRGGEVSNAHFPYYEFLFANSAASKEPILLSAKRFYFDVSGLEGNEWPWFFFLLSVVGFIITMGLLVPFARFRALRAAERQAARNDPAPQPEPEAVSDLPLGL